MCIRDRANLGCIVVIGILEDHFDLGSGGMNDSVSYTHLSREAVRLSGLIVAIR